MHRDLWFGSARSQKHRRLGTKTARLGYARAMPRSSFILRYSTFLICVACNGTVGSEPDSQTTTAAPRSGTSDAALPDDTEQAQHSPARDTAPGPPQTDSGLPQADLDHAEDGGVPAPKPGDEQSDLRLSFFNVTTGRVDPRFSTIPTAIAWAELLPTTTLLAEPPSSTRSVRFVVDGVERVDNEPPFYWSETPSGEASAWPLAGPAAHQLQVTAYDGEDGTGTVLAEHVQPLNVTAAGLDPTPDDGSHSVHKLWITGSDRYVQRDDDGNFKTADGTMVLEAETLHVEPSGNAWEVQGHWVTEAGAPDTIEFAFMLLLPEGFDTAVAYPLLVFLHHGWDAYRGTDNDGLPLSAPLLDGSRSISNSPVRHQHPAVILVPQLIRVETIAGVHHEWAAFTSVDNATGNATSAPEPSHSGRFVQRIVDTLLQGDLLVDGLAVHVDAARLYLTGHSMGGLGTWDLIARQPSLWAAAVPMAGYPDHSRAAALVETPIWAFHHKDDTVNPFIGSKTMHQDIMDAGGSLMRLSELSEPAASGSDAHNQTPVLAWEREDSLFEWLFSQTRASAP